MVLESCTGCSNRCVHAHRPGPCVLMCLLGPPRQHGAGLSGRHMGGSPPAAAPHRDTAPCQGSTSRMPRCACCGVSLGAGFSSTRLADLCFCADAPQSSGLCVLAADGASLGRHGSRTKSVSPSPPRPAASPARPAARPAAHTVQPCPSLPAHRAASAQPSAVRRRAATPCSPSAQHRLL